MIDEKTKTRIGISVLLLLLYAPWLFITIKYIPDANILTHIGVVGSVTVVFYLAASLIKK